jgi:O-antigen ligase
MSAASAAARLSGLLPAALLLYVAAAFLLPSDPAAALVFYLAVIPAALARLARRGTPWPLRPGAGSQARAAAVLALGLVLWSGLTLLWGEDAGHRTLKFAGDTLATLVFLLALLETLPGPALRRRLQDVLIGCGAANAALSIAIDTITHPLNPRLHGWGVTTHPILGASVMAVPYLTALCRGLEEAGRRWLSLAAAALMAAFILLTESRGPLLAASAATFLVCATGWWRWRCLATAAVVAALWALLPAPVREHSQQVLVQRGASHRIEIWEYSARMIAGRPLLGHGLAANLDLPEFTFPHDLYLSLLFYSGVVGLVLFLAMAALLARRALPDAAGREWRWLASLWLCGLASGLTDLGQITKGPGPMWFIIWLPAGLLMTLPPGRPGSGSHSPDRAGDAAPAPRAGSSARAG